MGSEIETDDYNRLAEDADYTYEYDKEGNLKQRTSKADTNLKTEYSYDHRNRLVRVQEKNGSTITDAVDYAYDANDQLVWRTDYVYDDGEVEEAFTEDYVNDGQQRVMTYDYEGTLSRRYRWGATVDQLLGEDIYNASGQLTDYYWAATDHLGSVNEILANNESIIEHREYDSFGALDAAFSEVGDSVSAGNLKSDFGYTGKFFDDATGLQFNNARWYDPATGRFMNEDPARDGSNWYAYASNDPVNFYDPSGLSPAGNPLNNLFGSFDAYAGGYSGGKVAPKPKDTYFNTNLLASPTLNYNPIGPVFGPVQTSSTTRGSARSSGRAGSSSSVTNFDYYGPLPTYDPLAPSPAAAQYAADARAYRSTQSNRPFQDVLADLREVERANNRINDPLIAAGGAVLGSTRFQGAARIGQAASEFYAATLLAPTGVGTAGAVALGFHAADTLQTGFHELVYGTPSQSVGSRAIENAANATGFHHQAAGLGAAYDILPGLLAPFGGGKPASIVRGPMNFAGVADDVTVRGSLSRPGSVSGNPSNRLIEVPNKNGQLVNRFVRITADDAQRYRGCPGRSIC